MIAVSEPRPWRRAAAWLAFLGPFFFASYGFANWLASRRDDVGAIVFAWERAIPFVPWTIVPYWSIDLFYAISVFLCTTRRELDRHAQRLLTVQLISIACFLAFPLRFTFARPEVGGVFGALFAALGSFDKPFNQAPSLHIALLVVIWARFAAHSSKSWRPILHVWMALIGVSILTTYQHHFVDLPTGLLVGLLALWALPDDAPSPLSQFAIARDPARRRLAFLYATGAAIFASLACIGGAWLWLFWPAISLVLVALNYLAIGERGFQKGSDGRLSIAALVLLAPYVAAAWVNSRLWTRNAPLPVEVKDGVWIGRIPSGNASSFPAIVDLAAELPCATRAGTFYRSVPVLDLTVPAEEKLRTAANAIEEGREMGPVLVCCALGYSRSASAVVAWLLTTRRAKSVADATRIVQSARPSIVLKREHHVALEAL